MIRFFLLVIVLLIHPAYADIYKCTGENGVATYSDVPCGDKAKIFYKSTPDDRTTSDEKDTKHSLSSVIIDGSLTKDQIYEKLKAHSRSLGGQVFKDESFAGFIERPRVLLGTTHYDEVTCFWGSRSSNNFENYSMTIKYTRGVKLDGKLVFRPNQITFSYRNQFHDPKSMKKITNFRKLSPGDWHNSKAF